MAFDHVPAFTWIVQFDAKDSNNKVHTFVMNLPYPILFEDEKDIIQQFSLYHTLEIKSWTTKDLPTFFTLFN